jgi:hypothetical protein
MEHVHRHPALVEGRSSIAGRGLFAAEPIAVGTVLIRFDDPIAPLLAASHPDVLPNHSCDPDAWWTDDVTLTALRDIAAGEEITFDYATATADPDFLLRCNCATMRCRGLVTGDDWRIPQLHDRYNGHWTAVPST